VVDKWVRDGGGDLAAPIIYYAAAPQRVWSAGGYFDRWLLEARGNVRGEKDEGQWPKVRTVDFVPACALLVPVGVWLEVGGFDERFFMYYEDLDFCWRLHQTGRYIRVLTEAKLWHKVSVSSGGSDSPSERYWMARSSVLYFRKHASFWQRPFISIWRLGSAVRTTGRLLWHRQGQSAYAYWRGLWAGIGERP
jgi:GT2 family glycosyltransferase